MTELHPLDKETMKDGGDECLGYYVYTCFTPPVSSRAVHPAVHIE